MMKFKSFRYYTRKGITTGHFRYPCPPPHRLAAPSRRAMVPPRSAPARRRILIYGFARAANKIVKKLLHPVK